MTEGPVSKCFNGTQDKQGTTFFHDPIFQDPLHPQLCKDNHTCKYVYKLATAIKQIKAHWCVFVC